MLTPTQLNEKKLALTIETLGLELKIIAYADSCRDSGNIPEYNKAVNALNSIQGIGLS